MNKKVSSSYLDEIGSGFDAEGYDGPQLGKAETEEVSEKNWGADNRDAVGKAAFISKRRRIARKLRRIASELESLNTAQLNDDYKSTIEESQLEEDSTEDIINLIDDVASGKAPSGEGSLELEDELEDIDDLDDDLEVVASKKQAKHPIEHDSTVDDPTANMPSDTGDEWIDIGPATFTDNRDVVGKAASKK